MDWSPNTPGEGSQRQRHDTYYRDHPVADSHAGGRLFFCLGQFLGGFELAFLLRLPLSNLMLFQRIGFFENYFLRCVQVVAQLVGEAGFVYTIERFKSLAEKAKKNLKQIGNSNVIVEVGDGSCGLPLYQPYDCIYITCAAPYIPQPLIDQLQDFGKLLARIGDMYCELTLLEKVKGKLVTHLLGGCVFVPLVGKFGQSD